MRAACVRRGNGDVLGRCGEGARRVRGCEEEEGQVPREGRPRSRLDLVSISSRSRLDLGRSRLDLGSISARSRPVRCGAGQRACTYAPGGWVSGGWVKAGGRWCEYVWCVSGQARIRNGMLRSGFRRMFHRRAQACRVCACVRIPISGSISARSRLPGWPFLPRRREQRRLFA